MDSQQRFGIRKLTIGACSLPLSTVFFGVGIAQQPTIVHAAEQSEQSQSNNSASQEDANRGAAGEIEQHDQAESSQSQENNDSAKQADPQTQIDNDVAKNGDAAALQSPKTREEPPNQPTNSPKEDSKTIPEPTGSKIFADPNKPKLQRDVDKKDTQLIKINPTAQSGDKQYQDKKIQDQLKETKKIASSTNDCLDEKAYGDLDINDWDTTIDSNYLNIIGYHGDLNSDHLIIPNGADFAKAGKNINNSKDIKVAISENDLNRILNSMNNLKSLAVSKTNNEKVKWTDTSLQTNKPSLVNIELNNLDTRGAS